MITPSFFNLAIEKANDNVTTNGNPSGIESTIIRKAAMKSDNTFIRVNLEIIFYCNYVTSLTIYNSKTMNIPNALIHPMKTKNLANVSKAFDKGDYSS